MEAYVEGIGVVGGFGSGLETFHRTLASGTPNTQVVSVKIPDGLRKLPAYLADTSTLEKFVQKKSLRRMDHYSRMALLGAYLALEDAGALDNDRTRLGIVVASGYGASRSTCAFLDSFIEGNDVFSSPTHFSNSVHNAAAANISITLGTRGPCLTVSQFEMSVPSALITAIGWLKEERVDKVLFGAVDEYCDVLGHCWHRFYGHNEGIAMDPFLFHEQTAILGEGAAFFLLSLNRAAGASYGGILEVKMEYTEKIDYFHSHQDLLILGADGHKVWGHRYAHLGKENTKMVAYTPLYGSFPTNMALDMAAALTCIKAQKLFAQPTGSSYPPSLNIMREEHIFVEGKIHCLKLAGNGGTGTILIAKD